MDSLHVDHTINHFGAKGFIKQFKVPKDEMQQAFGISIYDINSILKQLDTFTNEDLEKVIEHCNMLIERNNIEMGGVWIIKNVSLI